MPSRETIISFIRLSWCCVLICDERGSVMRVTANKFALLYLFVSASICFGGILFSDNDVGSYDVGFPEEGTIAAFGDFNRCTSLRCTPCVPFNVVLPRSDKHTDAIMLIASNSTWTVQVHLWRSSERRLASADLYSPAKCRSFQLPIQRRRSDSGNTSDSQRCCR